MIGFFRRHAAVLAAILVVAGLIAPGLTMAQQDPAKSAPPVLVPPANSQAAPSAPPAAVFCRFSATISASRSRRGSIVDMSGGAGRGGNDG